MTVAAAERPGLTAAQLELRKGRIGASEVAALFGESPWCTYWELWMRKAGRMPPERDRHENDAVFWGTVLEPAVARGVELTTGWRLTVRAENVAHKRMGRFGCYLDREIDVDLGTAKSWQPFMASKGALEIKCVDRHVYKGWINGEPPKHYLLQLQAQLACTGYAWGAIAVLVGGNDLKVFTYERHAATIARIEAEVAEFWHSVDTGEEPDIDFATDCDAILELYSSATPGKVLRMDDPDLAGTIAHYTQAAKAERAAAAEKKRHKAELMTVMQDAEELHCLGWKVTARMVPAAERSFVVPPYRTFHVGAPKQGKGKG